MNAKVVRPYVVVTVDHGVLFESFSSMNCRLWVERKFVGKPKWKRPCYGILQVVDETGATYMVMHRRKAIAEGFNIEGANK